jgi:hypothetical protein
MPQPDAHDDPGFLVRTSGRLVGRGKRRVRVTGEGITLEPGGHFAWSDFTGYRAERPPTLTHRDGRRLVLNQAGNDEAGSAAMNACVEDMARAIAAHNVRSGPAAQLGPDIEGEWRAARRQRAGMLAVAILAAVLTVVAWTVPAPIPPAAKYLPLTIVVIGVVYVIVLNRRLRALAAQRHRPRP